MIPALSYGRQAVDEEDIKAVADAMRGDFLTQGPTVDRFEAAIAAYAGARYAVSCANGTAALHLACLAAGAAPGWKTLTSTMTFVASANASLYCGADVSLIDIDPLTLGFDHEQLRQHLTDVPDTRIVIPVHMCGLATDLATVREIAGNRVIIEDACHAFGANYPDGTRVGNCQHSNMACFSFHPVKPLTTGEGGAITTNDPELYRLLRQLRSHGIERDWERFEDKGAAFEGGEPNPWYYEQQTLGFNYRLTDLQAALGLSQMRKLDDFIARRRHIARCYDAAFAGLDHVRPTQADPAMRARSGHHIYVVRIDFAGLGTTRRQFMADLRSRGIGTQVHYIPVHRQPLHRRRYGWKQIDFPMAELYYADCLTLPIHPRMTEENICQVVDAVTAFTKSGGR